MLVVPTTWFPKARVAGVSVTGSTPFPVRETVCGLLVALSVTVTVPVRVPVVVGVNVTLILQFAPAARVLPQLFV